MIKPEYQEMEERQKKIRELEFEELIKQYPKIKLKDKSKKLEQIGDDLFSISDRGRIELITNAIIWRCKTKKGFRIELEIKDFELIDEGMNPEEMRI